MFGFTARKKEQEAQKLADQFKERISELQLRILSGEMRGADLDYAKRALEILRTRLGIKVTEESRRLQGGQMKIVAFLVAIACLFITGCFGYVKPTESQKELNEQVIGAGDMISKTSVQAAVKQAGDDIVKAATTLQKTLVGEAAVKKPYSHEELEKIVIKVVKEYDESQAPWYKRWAGTLIAGITTLSTLAGIGGYFWPPAGVAARILKPVAEKLVEIKQAAETHPSDSLSLDAITAHTSELAKDPKIGGTLTTLLKEAHLEQMIHAPEASDPPPPAPAPVG